MDVSRLLRLSVAVRRFGGCDGEPQVPEMQTNTLPRIYEGAKAPEKLRTKNLLAMMSKLELLECKKYLKTANCKKNEWPLA